MLWDIPPSGESQYAVALKLLCMIAEVEGWKVPNAPNSWNVERADILGTFQQCLAATGLPLQPPTPPASPTG
jgi:hypothetical protein